MIETLIQSGVGFQTLMDEYETNRRYFNNYLKLYDVMSSTKRHTLQEIMNTIPANLKRLQGL